MQLKLRTFRDPQWHLFQCYNKKELECTFCVLCQKYVLQNEFVDITTDYKAEDFYKLRSSHGH